MAHVVIYQAGFAPQNPHAYQLFLAVDRDRSGSISLPELHSALTHGGYVSFSIKTTRLLMRMYDADRSGALSYYEFERLLATLTQLKSYFDSHTHGTGRLAPAGLVTIVRATGFALPDPLINMMFFSVSSAAKPNMCIKKSTQPTFTQPFHNRSTTKTTAGL
jgi:Ca2+-binding EF-hand superfamily protein